MVVDVADKELMRGYVPKPLARQIKALVGIKNGQKDWSLSDVMTEALEEWLQKPENQALIKKHKLDDLDT